MNNKNVILAHDCSQEFVHDYSDGSAIYGTSQHNEIRSNTVDNIPDHRCSHYENEINHRGTQSSMMVMPHHSLQSSLPFWSSMLYEQSTSHHVQTSSSHLLNQYHNHLVLDNIPVKKEETDNHITHSNIPNSLLDTPPFSNTPSPQNLHYQYHSRIQPTPQNNVGLLPQCATLHLEQKSSDLRPYHRSQSFTQVQNWNSMRTNTSVAISENERFLKAEYLNLESHRRHQHEQDQSENVCNEAISSDGNYSTTNSTSGRTNSRASSFISNSISDSNHNLIGSHISNDIHETISDESLVKLSLPELNARIKGYPKDYRIKLKRRRRTLKNRKYAQICRENRQEKQKEMQRLNDELTRKIIEKNIVIEMLQTKLRTLTQGNDSYASETKT